jgi:choice-of-anchor A domain-containing protein
LIADADLNGAGFSPSPGGVIAVVMALPVSLNGGVQFQPFIIEVPCCPACVDPALGLGAATGCTVLQLTNHKVDITGPAGGILGNVCMAPNSALSMSGDEYITGTVKLGPGAKFTNSSHTSPIVMMNVDLTAEIAAANARASSAASLVPTQTFTTLDGKGVNTITGVVGINVIKVTDINLSGKQITLTGPPGAKFILNVSGKFVLTGGGQGPQIRAGSGVQPKDILYNIIGSGPDVTFSGGGGGTNCCAAIVDGTLLAPQRKISLAPGLVNGEIISGLDISIVSGSSVRCPKCQ